MSLFRNKYHYKLPERLSPEEARSRRLTAQLERERRFADVPNFLEVSSRLQRQAEALSRAQKKLSADPELASVKGERRSSPKAFSTNAAILRRYKSLTADEFAALPQAHKNHYKALRRASLEAKHGSPSGGDNRRFNPTGKGAATRSGTLARVAGVRNFLQGGWVPVFVNPWKALPCIQRSVRREVMFAQQHAGKGYRVRHRRNINSGVPC